MNEAKLVELYNSWDAIVKHKEKMGRTLLELIAHPDSTPEMLTDAMSRYKLIVAQLREHKPVVAAALAKGRSWRVTRMADDVRVTHI